METRRHIRKRKEPRGIWRKHYQPDFDKKIMELFEENVINGNALQACLKYLEGKGVELNDFDVRRYSSIGLYEYYMFVDHCDEYDPEYPIISMYSHVHMFALQDDKVTMYFNGFWITLKNFIMQDSFVYNLLDIRKELGDKAIAYKKTLFPELFNGDSDGIRTDSNETKEVLDFFENTLSIDTTDHYVFVGDEYDFIDDKDKVEHIFATRHLLTRFIRLNFDIESKTEDMQKYVEASKGNRLQESNGYYYKKQIF